MVHVDHISSFLCLDSDSQWHENDSQIQINHNGQSNVFEFDGCFPREGAIEAIVSQSGLDLLVKQVFEGYNCGILLLGLGSVQKDKNRFIHGIGKTFRRFFMDALHMYEISFGCCVLDVSDEGVVDRISGKPVTPEQDIDELWIECDHVDQIDTMLEGNHSQSIIVFKLVLETRHESVINRSLASTFCLVDLGMCGYEVSLPRTLSHCRYIGQILSESGSGHVPYERMQVTRILSEYIGGNSKTSLVMYSDGSINKGVMEGLELARILKRVRNRVQRNVEDWRIGRYEQTESTINEARTMADRMENERKQLHREIECRDIDAAMERMESRLERATRDWEILNSRIETIKTQGLLTMSKQEQDYLRLQMSLLSRKADRNESNPRSESKTKEVDWMNRAQFVPNIDRSQRETSVFETPEILSGFIP